VALYTLLVGSFGLAIWTRRFPNALPWPLEQASPWLFLAFVVVFAFYRLGLVRAQKYPASKAFFQIGAGVLLFTLLLSGLHDMSLPNLGSLDDVEVLLRDPNPRVRALAAELARHREGGARYAKALVHSLEDPDPKVRDQAHQSLIGLTGQDLGAPATPGGMKAWKERYP